jgi:hypothetical protein
MSLLLTSLMMGCVSLEIYDGEAKIGDVSIFGQGCVLVSRDANGNIEALLQHAGMSQVFGGTLRSIVSVAGEVFGGSTAKQDELKATGGCADVLESSMAPADGQGNTSGEE